MQAEENSTSAGSSAYIVLSIIVYFDPSVSSQHRQDVLQSTLLAHLAADKQVDRKSDPKTWIQQFESVLNPIGWSASVEFREHTSKTTTYSLGKVIPGLFKDKDAAAAQGAEQAIGAVDALPPGDAGRKVFEVASQGEGSGSVQVAVATESGVLTVHMVSVHVATTQQQTSAADDATTQQQTTANLLRVSFEASKTQLLYGVLILTFNEAIYAPVRDAVTERLQKANAMRFVVPLGL